MIFLSLFFLTQEELNGQIVRITVGDGKYYYMEVTDGRVSAIFNGDVNGPNLNSRCESPATHQPCIPVDLNLEDGRYALQLNLTLDIDGITMDLGSVTTTFVVDGGVYDIVGTSTRPGTGYDTDPISDFGVVKKLPDIGGLPNIPPQIIDLPGDLILDKTNIDFGALKVTNTGDSDRIINIIGENGEFRQITIPAGETKSISLPGTSENFGIKVLDENRESISEAALDTKVFRSEDMGSNLVAKIRDMLGMNAVKGDFSKAFPTGNSWCCLFYSYMLQQAGVVPDDYFICLNEDGNFDYKHTNDYTNTYTCASCPSMYAWLVENGFVKPDQNRKYSPDTEYDTRCFDAQTAITPGDIVMYDIPGSDNAYCEGHIAIVSGVENKYDENGVLVGQDIYVIGKQGDKVKETLIGATCFPEWQPVIISPDYEKLYHDTRSLVISTSTFEDAYHEMYPAN